MWREILSTRGSLLVCTRLAGDNAASASDDSGKSAYTHTHTCIHIHVLARSCLSTQQTRRIILMLVTWERHKQVHRIVALRLQLFSLTGEELAVAGEGAG